MNMRRHQHSKQSPCGAFRIDDGTIVDGRDQLPVLLETSDGQLRPRQRVLHICELADGWYEVFRDGTVRGCALANARFLRRRRMRSSPTIRANKTPTAVDELFRNFVAAAAVLALLTVASFVIMGLWK
jgi:hypothetical protein